MYELWGKLIVDSRHSHVAHHRYIEKVIREMSNELDENRDNHEQLLAVVDKWKGVPV